MNSALLKYQMSIRGKSGKSIEEGLGISHSAFSRKLNGKSEFTCNEIKYLIRELDIENPEAIFFDE